MSDRLLALWSVPRARSTAFLRMMAERGDLTVVHEPFSRVAHFGSVAVGDRMCRSAPQVIQALRVLTEQGPVFFKDTLDRRHRAVLADGDFQRAVTHSFMIRSPDAVVASYLRLDASAERYAMGFENLAELYDAVCASTGQDALVVDADEQTHPGSLPVELRRLAEAFVAYHRPFYDRLLARTVPRGT